MYHLQEKFSCKQLGLFGHDLQPILIDLFFSMGVGRENPSRNSDMLGLFMVSKNVFSLQGGPLPVINGVISPINGLIIG